MAPPPRSDKENEELALPPPLLWSVPGCRCQVLLVKRVLLDHFGQQLHHLVIFGGGWDAHQVPHWVGPAQREGRMDHDEAEPHAVAGKPLDFAQPP